MKQPIPKKVNGYYKFEDNDIFRPNLSPVDVIKMGSFGGTYFRPIKSQVTNKEHKNHYKKCLPNKFISSLSKEEIKNKLTRPFNEYDISVNKYKVKCGQTLEQWESKNWITQYDPYGWFEWYCNYFYGRRIASEDERQIKRWQNLASNNGRFKKRLVNMIKKSNKDYNDISISPVIRQTLQHWAIKITKKDISS